jgi:solute carrier family 25 (adenine nucleotide translocator) protein 4/5/6/31
MWDTQAKMADKSQSTDTGEVDKSDSGDTAVPRRRNGPTIRRSPTPNRPPPPRRHSSAAPAPPKKLTYADLVNQLATDFCIGTVAKSAVAPMERIRLVLQTQSLNPLTSGEVQTIKTTIECVKRIYSDQGILGFWKGNLVICLRFFPLQFSTVVLHDIVSRKLNKLVPPTNSRVPTWRGFIDSVIRGGIIGSVSALVCYPMDVFHTLISTDLGITPRFSGSIDCLFKTIKDQGLWGLFTGWPSSVVGIFVYRFGQLCIFKKLQEFSRDRGLTGVKVSFLIVTLSRILVMPLVYPLDTIRRLQILDASKPIDQRQFKNSIDCFQQVLSKEGISGFYNGMPWDILRGIAGSLAIIAIDSYWINSPRRKAFTDKLVAYIRGFWSQPKPNPTPSQMDKKSKGKRLDQL